MYWRNYTPIYSQSKHLFVDNIITLMENKSYITVMNEQPYNSYILLDTVMSVELKHYIIFYSNSEYKDNSDVKEEVEQRLSRGYSIYEKPSEQCWISIPHIHLISRRE